MATVYDALAFIYSDKAYEILKGMGCSNITGKETVVNLFNDCELTEDYELDSAGFYYYGYNSNNEPVYYSTEGFDSLFFTPLGLASHRILYIIL